MATDPERLFNIPDADMILRAQVNHADATDDLAALTARVPAINVAWLAAFLVAINNAKNYPTDDNVKLELGDFSALVEESMVAARAALAAVNGWAEMAFEDDERKQQSFGQEKWAEAGSDHEKMRLALKLAQSRCNQPALNAALLLATMTQAEIDALGTLADELEARNIIQEEAKGDRKTSTASRILLHNIVWKLRKKLKVAAMLTWPTDATKQEQYQLYPSGHGDAATVVDITIKRAGVPLADATVKISNTPLAPVVTGVDGIAHFESVNMPESIEVEATHDTYGSINGTFSPIEGEDNDFDMTY